MKTTFASAIRSGFVNFRVFRSTASRSQYWYFVLFTVLLSVVLSTIESVIWPPALTGDLIDLANQNTPLSNLAALILLLPSISLTARRIRDAGWSAKWLLLIFLPLLPLIQAAPGLFEYLSGVIAPTDEELMVAASYLLPTFATALAVQLFLLVLTLLPSKSKDAGNRYAS
jgi:uncharacterized membrane protein YhaH (DUF805 family)